MSKSIMQREKECYICQNSYAVECGEKCRIYHRYTLAYD